MYSVSETVLNALQIFFQFPQQPHDLSHYHAHFPDGDTEAREIKWCIAPKCKLEQTRALAAWLQSALLATALHWSPTCVPCSISCLVQATCTYRWYVPSTSRVRVCLSCVWPTPQWGGEAEHSPAALTPATLASFRSCGFLHMLFLRKLIKLFSTTLRITKSFSCFPPNLNLTSSGELPHQSAPAKPLSVYFLSSPSEFLCRALTKSISLHINVFCRFLCLQCLFVRTAL